MEFSCCLVGCLIGYVIGFSIGVLQITPTEKEVINIKAAQYNPTNGYFELADSCDCVFKGSK